HGHHEIRGGGDARGCAETLQRETRKCVNEPSHACENHYRAEAARQLQTKERRLELPTRDRPWNEPRQRTWGDHEENRRAQDGNGSLHGGSPPPSLRAHSNLPFIRTTNQCHIETFMLVCVEGPPWVVSGHVSLRPGAATYLTNWVQTWSEAVACNQ